MKKEKYKEQIGELDKTIDMLRQGWMEAGNKEKNKWMERINCLLEQRCEFMQLRDKEQNASKKTNSKSKVS